MAKKSKMEMEIGLQFCETLQSVIHRTLHELQEQQQQEQQQQQQQQQSKNHNNATVDTTTSAEASCICKHPR